MIFLKTILIILLVYFGIKVLARYLGPFLLKYIFKKVQKNMEKQFNPPHQETDKKSHETSKSKPKNSKVGEYVDYEEIE